MIRHTLGDTRTIALRDLRHWFGDPIQIVGGLAYPIVFVLLFCYVFGSGMQVPGGGDYLDFLMPGLFAMTMAFGIGNTMAAVQADAAQGITDRFRSMPMAPAAVVLGRSVADMVNSSLDLALLLGCGAVIGWDADGTVADVAAAVGLLLLLRFAFLWVGIFLGLLATSEAAVAAMWGLLFPVTMITRAFVAPELMPDWLGAIAQHNPISATVDATRELFGAPGTGGDTWAAEHAMLLAVLWPVLLVAVFLPLSVRRYRRLSR